MVITIDWQEPIQLTKYKKVLIDKDALPDAIQNIAGVYFFSRKFGNLFKPFYIGETLTLRTRLKLHLGTTKIDHVLREIDDVPQEIKGGARYFHFGYYHTNAADETKKKRMRIVQKYLIRTALEENITLLNKQLTTITTDEIVFSGSATARGIYRKTANVEA